MSWILEYFVVYLLCMYMFGWLCPAKTNDCVHTTAGDMWRALGSRVRNKSIYCSVVSTSMLGVSHAVQNEVQNEKKL